MIALPAFGMIAFTSAKSTLIMPGIVMMSRDALHALAEHVVRHLERFQQRLALLGHVEQAVVGDGDDRVDPGLELGDAFLGEAEAARALEVERLGDDADGEGVHSRAISAMTGAAPVPVPPPMPAVMNTMSEPSSSFLMS